MATQAQLIAEKEALIQRLSELTQVNRDAVAMAAEEKHKAETKRRELEEILSNASKAKKEEARLLSINKELKSEHNGLEEKLKKSCQKELNKIEENIQVAQKAIRENKDAAKAIKASDTNKKLRNAGLIGGGLLAALTLMG